MSHSVSKQSSPGECYCMLQHATEKNAFHIGKNIIGLNWECMIHLIVWATCFIFGVISETLGTTPMPMSGLSIPQKKFLIKRGILRSY